MLTASDLVVHHNLEAVYSSLNLLHSKVDFMMQEIDKYVACC